MSTFIILWLIWACCMAAIIAGKKGHSAVSFFAGLILGVFGVLLAWWQDDLTKAEPPAARNRITAFSAPYWPLPQRLLRAEGVPAMARDRPESEGRRVSEAAPPAAFQLGCSSSVRAWSIWSYA